MAVSSVPAAQGITIRDPSWLWVGDGWISFRYVAALVTGVVLAGLGYALGSVVLG